MTMLCAEMLPKKRVYPLNMIITLGQGGHRAWTIQEKKTIERSGDGEI